MHASHSLEFSPELALWYCTVCGQYAAVAARGLGSVCKGKTPHRGKKNLDAITKGEWPQDCPMPASHARLLEARRLAAPLPHPSPAVERQGEAPRIGDQSLDSSGRTGQGPSEPRP